jgi:hypothetical protein
MRRPERRQARTVNPSVYTFAGSNPAPATGWNISWAPDPHLVWGFCASAEILRSRPFCVGRPDERLPSSASIERCPDTANDKRATDAPTFTSDTTLSVSETSAVTGLDPKTIGAGLTPGSTPTPIRARPAARHGTSRPRTWSPTATSGPYRRAEGICGSRDRARRRAPHHDHHPLGRGHCRDVAGGDPMSTLRCRPAVRGSHKPQFVRQGRSVGKHATPWPLTTRRGLPNSWRRWPTQPTAARRRTELVSSSAAERWSDV